MIEAIAYMCFGFALGYAYYHKEKVKEGLHWLITLIDNNSSK